MVIYSSLPTFKKNRGPQLMEVCLVTFWLRDDAKAAHAAETILPILNSALTRLAMPPRRLDAGQRRLPGRAWSRGQVDSVLPLPAFS